MVDAPLDEGTFRELRHVTNSGANQNDQNSQISSHRDATWQEPTAAHNSVAGGFSRARTPHLAVRSRHLRVNGDGLLPGWDAED